jgi:DNA-binding Lrp family transcriptional regulator
VATTRSSIHGPSATVRRGVDTCSSTDRHGQRAGQQRGADRRNELEAGLADIPHVRHAERLFGDPDYLVRIATTDIHAYQQLRDTRLARLPGVEKITSTIVMRRIVDGRPYVIN